MAEGTKFSNSTPHASGDGSFKTVKKKSFTRFCAIHVIHSSISSSMQKNFRYVQTDRQQCRSCTLDSISDRLERPSVLWNATVH